MSDCLTQEEVCDLTALVRPGAQKRKLLELGYIVLGNDAKGRVKALRTHPLDPSLNASGDNNQVVLDLS